MKNWILPAAALAAAAVLAGCASSPCRDVLDYRSARQAAPPTIPQGMAPLAPDVAYDIPSGKFATENPKTKAQCIAYPPQVVKPGEKAEPAEPPKE